jgi:hypothetical protein
MSRILIVEPYRLLQYAFAAALCPDHELSIVKAIPETAEGADLAIVDAAALRERELLSGLDFELIRSWRVPVVWLGTDDPEVPTVDRLKRVKLPLDRETLKQALTALQALSETSTRTMSDATTRGDGRAAKKAKFKAAKTSGAASESNRNIVELVDVVEEIADDGSQMESVKKE